jgi:hypothetical protein
MVFRKLKLIVFVPVRVAAPPKTNRSDVLALSTSKLRAAVLREMPELPRVIVRVVPSAKLNVEPVVAFRLVMLVESAFAPLKRSVPPPVERIAPLLVFEPESVVV